MTLTKRQKNIAVGTVGTVVAVGAIAFAVKYFGAAAKAERAFLEKQRADYRAKVAEENKVKAEAEKKKAEAKAAESNTAKKEDKATA